jgi:hypothetical protein
MYPLIFFLCVDHPPIQMRKAENASHIRTVFTTTASRYSQSKTKTGKLQLSVDEKSGSGHMVIVLYGNHPSFPR